MNQTHLYCPACEREYDPGQGLFGCPRAGDGREHILEQRPAVSPGCAEELLESWREHPGDPLLAFAPLACAQELAGRPAHLANVRALQDGLARNEGHGLRVTPLALATDLARAAGHHGPLYVKNETGQVGGSHKARHLAGTMLYLEALRRGGPKRPLAISSCGNAALAAACVARAAGYALTTFVPEDVHPQVRAMLTQRGADVRVVPRLSTGGGDPCYLAFRKAVAGGAVPFCCSGRDNWSNVEGGRSLGYETALQWLALGVMPQHLVLQIGGGALARAVAEAFAHLHALGLVLNLPRIHACQTEGAYPFARAWLLLVGDIAREAGLDMPRVEGLAAVRAALSQPHPVLDKAVDLAREHFGTPLVEACLRRAVNAPDRYMWAWDGPAPHSLAHGILADETYDWVHLARLMLRTGGRAVVAREPLVERAQALVLNTTDIAVSATGSAGLAGMLALAEAGALPPQASVGLFCTGINR